jgi:multidrug efflux pump subunit AcrB
MWIVRLALRRPYTFAVFAILLLLIGAFSILSMPTDIFPNINIPVVSVVWQFTGLSSEEMSNRIIANSERGMTTTVNDIEHIESQSLNGIGVIKIFFQPHVDIGSAVAEVTAISQVQLRSLPPGTTPPFIIQYNASSVPVLQLGLSGQGLSEQQLGDLGTNLIRTQLATVEGASIPYPYGPQPACPAIQRPVSKRRRHRHQRAESHRPLGHHESRQLRVRGRNQLRTSDSR